MKSNVMLKRKYINGICLAFRSGDIGSVVQIVHNLSSCLYLCVHVIYFLFPGIFLNVHQFHCWVIDFLISMTGCTKVNIRPRLICMTMILFLFTLCILRNPTCSDKNNDISISIRPSKIGILNRWDVFSQQFVYNTPHTSTHTID
jgi:hypothetical protein